MDRQVGNTFESIESAHDFVRLLSEVVTETGERKNRTQVGCIENRTV